MKSKKLISIVVPVYNEELGIPELISQLTKFANKTTNYDFEFILVENGSIDNSFKLLQRFSKKDSRIKVIQLARNVGCDGGIEAGMQYAKGDGLVIMMADLQEPIGLILDFINQWEKGYDIVYGVVKKRTSSFTRNVFSILFYKIINLLTGDMFPENASDFRLIDKKVYQIINSLQERNKYLRGLIAWTGFKQIGVPFDRNKRFAGESKANFLTVLKVAANGIFSFSYIPLRFISILGFIITIFSFLMIGFYLYLFIIWGRVAPGTTTIILLLLFLFGILFFVLGIISEYLVRIYEEAKSRPTYIIKNKINLN
ncbi:MAG: glycosyltransferase family 2 protein [Patescibacteria group bacterium]|jgi:dolichol-phosphate mannosyltransferase